MEISSLAKASIGYPLEVIRDAIENVLNIERRIKLKFRPLDVQEILDELIKWDGPPAKYIKQFSKFENKTPLGRKKIKLMKTIQ